MVLRRAMFRAFAVLALFLITDLASGCGCACSGACNEPGVLVIVKGVPIDEIAEFTPSGVCGPRPFPLCSHDNEFVDGSSPCHGAGSWIARVPAKGTGTCEVDLKLVDGGTIKGSTTATEFSGSCCPGTYGDSALVLTAPDGG